MDSLLHLLLLFQPEPAGGVSRRRRRGAAAAGPAAAHAAAAPARPAPPRPTPAAAAAAPTPTPSGPVPLFVSVFFLIHVVTVLFETNINFISFFHRRKNKSLHLGQDGEPWSEWVCASVCVCVI